MRERGSLVILFIFIVAFVANAQQEGSYLVAPDRMLWHDQIDRSQSELMQLVARQPWGKDSAVQSAIDLHLMKGADVMQRKIELDTRSTNVKKRYLRALEMMLKGYKDRVGQKDFPPLLAEELMAAFESCLLLDLENQTFLSVIQQASYGVGKILVDCFVFPYENIGLQDVKVELVRKYCGLHPDEILSVLRTYHHLYFADSLIALVAQKDLYKLYDYAQARNELGDRIRKHSDSTVQLIASMANSKNGQLYFPFIEELLRGNLHLSDIDSVKNNQIAYFRLMVNTRIRYVERMNASAKDTARGMEALTEMMTRKAREVFVNEINALHAEPVESKRFKILDRLNSQELYYIAVLSDNIIYTSSFVKGVYPRMIQRLNDPCSDSLMRLVRGDYFRKFIKMCAGYNTLNDFLDRQENDDAAFIMQSFVRGLENTEGVEDAVDVADAYSSIVDRIPQLAKFIRMEVDEQLRKNVLSHHAKGAVVYRILDVLFKSADTTYKLDIAKELGIMPIYEVSLKSLRDDSGRVVMQVFFYGDDDKDGQHSFASFMGLFRDNPNWKILENNEWVGITAAQTGKVQIFANKPLMGDNDPEEKAIDHLNEYLEKKKLSPTIFVHRGHSFHVRSTMKRITSDARIVILGSCGGYNNINEVLKISPDAHIISSKQTGTMHVNEPLLQVLYTRLNAGKSIRWIPLWKELTTKLNGEAGAKEKFDDYIPPYKNLGAIFIKAYQSQIGKTTIQ